MLNKTIDILYRAKQEGIEIVLNEERLNLKVPKNKIIDQVLIEEIKVNKQAIIDFLKSSRNDDSRQEITSFNRDEIKQVPLSFSQERLWFIDRLSGSVEYNLPTVLRLRGRVNVEALQLAFEAVIDRHEVLRSVYHEENGQPYQVVKEKNQWKLSIVDGSKYIADKNGLSSFVQTLVRKPFELSADYMLRSTLINLEENEHLLVVTLHHIASDGWSMSIIVKEFVDLYLSFVQQKGVQLTPLHLQYADYAVWQRNYLQGDVLDQKLNYWKTKLQSAAPLSLPTDFVRPSVQNTNGLVSEFAFDAALTDQLRHFCQQQGATMFMTLLAAFKVLLLKYSNQEDITVGTSIASRQQKEIENLVGYFVNTLALRTEVRSNSSFLEFLQRVKTTISEAYDHQEVPFEKVVNAVVEERDASRTPLFQVMLVWQSTPEVPVVKLGELELITEKFESNDSKFDITFFMNGHAGQLKGAVQYRNDLYTSATITRLTAHYQHLLRSIVANPDQKVSELNMLGEEELTELQTFNRDAVAYPKEKTVVALFEEQAARTPQAPAVVFEGAGLSYQELNERSNQLAHYLRERGVKEDQLVPMCIERSAGMMVAMLGILKAGAGYVPIDTDFPADRIGYMLEDTAATIVVSSKASRTKLPAGSAEVIEIDAEALDNQPTENPTTSLQPHHLAYVIYTSGSTGQPKGVMIEHRNLVDYVWGLNQKTQIGECRSYALVSTIATDLGNTVIYSSLLLGGALHIFSKEAVSNIEYLHEYFAEHRIDCLKIVPSHFKALSNEGALLLPRKLLVFGGEALQAEVIEDIRAEATSTCRIVNHYGPTETTIGKLLHVVDRSTTYSNTVPIGKPFSNTRVYVLSKSLQLCPIGVPGQLYIAGDGVARGYLNNAELTATKFIKDPFDKEGQSLMYATGDQVKYLDKGEIEFIGRIDNQVKIRGYRVEPGEIESMLQQCRGVSQGVVQAGEDKQGNKRLTGYVVPQGAFDREGIIRQLKEKLPEYMIPAMLVELESLPLTPNGKVDRKALPDPEAGEVLGEQYVAPRNEAEQKLADIWQDVLEVDQVGVHDDFFELGGHSLLAVRLISAIRKAFKVEMPISHVFDYPTVALLAGQLESQSRNVLPAIEVLQPRPEHIPLSFSQERLWFIDKLEGSVQYHVPAVLGLKGKLNTAALEFALKTIVNRHEVLRTVFIEQDGQARQQVKDNDQWQLSQKDGREYKDDQPALQQYIQELINEPFDLSKDDMLRAALITLSEEEHVLVVTLHHIASDGWSRSILVREVAELYAAFEDNRPVQLAQLPIQYADYALWQRQYLQGEVLDTKLQYWKDKLQDTEPLQLPTDYTRPAVQTTKGASANFRIEKELATALNELSQQQGSTLFMTLLAVFKVLLYRYTGQKDICVGTPIAGRQQQELEGLIGFFLNTLALRTHLDGQQSFTDFLKEVRATTMEAYEHQEVPFEKVVDAVVKERDLSRTPLFQVMFILQNTPIIKQLGLRQLELTEEGFDHDGAKFEITLSLKETAEGIDGAFEYNDDLFSRVTIDRMTVHFKELVTSIVQTPEQKIAALPMLTARETHHLIAELNDTAVNYPTEKTIIGLFEEQAAKTPYSVALVFEEQQLNYKDLNERANQLAHYLQSKGVQAETLVAICIERSLEMIVGILGILKAGGAYVPIDPEYPAERIKYMLEDTAARLVVTSKRSQTKLPALEGVEIVEVGEKSAGSEKVSLQTNRSNTFCIVYTSGSTGKSKGVKITNAGVVNRLYWMWYTYPFENNETGAIKTSISFVDHVWELFGTLTSGIPAVIFKKEDLLDIDLLYKKLALNKITRWVLVPSLLQALLDKLSAENLTLPALKYWTCSGETLPFDLVKEFYSIFSPNSYILLNIYGSSEVTADVTYYDTSVDFINPDSFSASNLNVQQVSIGKPLSNCKVFILDTNNSLVPQGAIGEICVAGVQVADGYLNRPELTAEKFVTLHLGDGTNERIYKTGDLGRWSPGGNIQYLGRLDTQVKIRGNRVELGEVESVLQGSGLVNQAVVLAKDDKEGAKALVAYVVADPFDKQAVLSYLNEKLPDYMIPAIWVGLPSLPLLPNGKIDKKALPEPDATEQLSKVYVATTNELEEKLAEIWQRLLKIERVGIEDNFFQIGGHSLLAARVVSAIRKEVQVELAIKDLFVHPSIKALANHIGTQNKVLLPPIEVKSRPAKIPLSFSQERLWFIDKLEGSVQYHIPAVLKLVGSLNQQALEHAFKTIVSRHEVLRTVFWQEEDLPYQIIKEAKDWQLNIINEASYLLDARNLNQQIEEFIAEPFNLMEDYMLRAHLIQLQEQEHILVVTTHHIASDGWSTSILVKEVAELYRSYTGKYEAQLQALPIQYADYAIWQRNHLQGQLLDEKLQFWKEKLQGVTPLQLSTDYPRPSLQSTKGALATFTVDKKILRGLYALGKQQDATLFMTLLAAFNVLLHRYSGQDDICIGTPIANRSHQEVEELIGFFVNTLALRNKVESSASFIQLLQEVKNSTLQAYEHQDVPFEKVVDQVVKERDLSRSPLFQVMFVLQNTPEIDEIKLGNVELSAETMQHSTAKFEITLTVVEADGKLLCSIEYNSDLYSSGTIERLMEHYCQLLSSIIARPDERVGDLQMLTAGEENVLLNEFNKTAAEYPKDKTIVDLFEEQALKTPDNIAVVYEDGQLSYKELNEKVNQLARYLQMNGVQVETLVPICTERSLEMIVGILAILKAGGVYVPIDPEYPAERIRYMLEDTAAKLVLISRQSKAKLPGLQGVELLELDDEAIVNQPTTNLETLITPNNLAYIIYTSGSTGKPKGVMIEHRNVVRLFKTDKPLFDFNERDVWTMFHSFCFDFSVWEMYGALFYGGRVVVVPGHVTKDVTLFTELLLKEKVTILNQTPSAFYVLQDYVLNNLKEISVRYVIFGGEALNPTKLQPWKMQFPYSKLVNMYGITETTVHVTYKEIGWEQIQGTGSIIGKPIPTLSAYILDATGQLQPVGVAGELHISGAGLARGYLNRSDLTSQRFIKDPFAKEQGSKMYRTGDLGRWLADGDIEYLGRIDDQVKIRGFRIELGEIETVLLQSGLIRQAVVLAKTDANESKRLVAYVVAEGPFDKRVVTDHLQSKLPEYMVPALWVELENFPLTSNGKIDKQALPDPNVNNLVTDEYAEPVNEFEKALAKVWQELLGVNRVGLHDNFFALGGDSILSIQVVTRINRLGYSLQPKDIFIHQTIGQLSIATAGRAALVSTAEQGTLIGPAGLLPIQQWYFESEPKDVSHFNQSILLSINKLVTAEILEEAVKQLIDYHDALRFKYYKQDGKWHQEYGSVEPSLVIEDFSTTNQPIEPLITQRARGYQRSLDIEKGDLVKIVLMQTPEGDKVNRLLIVIHHLAVDGVSWRILLEDLELLISSITAGETISLGKKTNSYRQWFQALQQYGQSKRLLSQKDQWEEVSKGYQPIQTDKEYAKPVKIKDTAPHQVRLSREETQHLLQEVPKVYHTEINDILLGALAKAVSDCTKTDNVVIGLEGHGREHIAEGLDTSRTVGWFTTLYPILLEVASNDYDELIKNVKEQLRKVPDKGIGYGILKYVNKEERLQVKEPWDIVFNYLGQLDNAVKEGKWLFGAQEPVTGTMSENLAVTYKISITCYIQKGELVINFSYSKNHFLQETIEKVAETFKLKLQQIIAHCIDKQKAGKVIFTPSDFGMGADITVEELDRFLEEEEEDNLDNILSF